VRNLPSVSARQGFRSVFFILEICAWRITIVIEIKIQLEARRAGAAPADLQKIASDATATDTDKNN